MTTRATRVRAFACAAVLMALLAAPSPARAGERFASARKAFNDGRLDEALALADAAASDPGMKPYALHLRAEIRFMRGELDLALADFVAAAASVGGAGPVAESSTANAAMVLTVISARRLDEGDGPGALESVESAKKLRPDYAPAWFSSGSVKSGFGDLAGAAEDFSRYLELKPESAAREALARHMLGMIEWDSWNLPGAREQIARAAELDPDNKRYKRDLEAIDEVTASVKRTGAAENRLALLVAASLVFWAMAAAAGFRYLPRFFSGTPSSARTGQP